MIRKGLLTTTFLLALSSWTHAATLFTPPLFPLAGELSCSVLNVSKAVLTVTISILDQDGAAVLSGPGFSLAPGQTQFAAMPAAAGPRYCKFEFKGGKNKVRAAGSVFQSGVGSIGPVPAQ